MKGKRWAIISPVSFISTALLNNFNAQRKMIKELKAELLAAKDANGKCKKSALKINGVVCSKQILVAYNRFISNYPSSSTINHLNMKDGITDAEWNEYSKEEKMTKAKYLIKKAQGTAKSVWQAGKALCAVHELGKELAGTDPTSFTNKGEMYAFLKFQNIKRNEHKFY